MRDSEVTLRPVQLADYSGISSIYKSVIEEYRTSLAEREVHENLSDEMDIEYLRSYANTQSSFVALIEDKSIVGFILARVIDWINSQKKTLWLEYIAVSPNYRRRSIGLKLVEEVKRYAHEHPIDALYTALNVDNEPSKDLLIKAGFTVKDWRIAFLQKMKLSTES
jgi:ribosomal protein S18 acetylase RimI-like enzyme